MPSSICVHWEVQGLSTDLESRSLVHSTNLFSKEVINPTSEGVLSELLAALDSKPKAVFVSIDCVPVLEWSFSRPGVYALEPQHFLSLEFESFDEVSVNSLKECLELIV